MLECIKKFFENEVKPIVKVAVVIGHEKSRKGARLYYGEYEYDYNCEVATKLALKIDKLVNTVGFPKQVRIFYRDHIGRYGVAEQVGVWGADVVLELHVNASGIKGVEGAEILIINKNTNSFHKHSNLNYRSDIENMH